MTAFPIFRRLTTSGYGLYPGTKSKADLDVQFQSGLTLVLGANGLGKTTLVSILYRMCTGPTDIPGLQSEGRLGGIKRNPRKLSAGARRIFADRVNDDAESATATLTLTLGDTELKLTRSLANLELTQLCRDGKDEAVFEDKFQELIKEHAGVNSFGDWILVLRHLVFYFEERRALVWDPSAQRQLLRVLFLAPTASNRWSNAERDVLQRDSRMRNLQAVVGKEETALTESEQAVSSKAEIRKELATLEKLQGIDLPKLDELNEQVVSLSAAQHKARVELLHAESEQESRFRDLERLQLTAIANAFPDSSETARYLMTQLVVGGECLVCGASSPQTVKQLKERISATRCVVCNSGLADAPKGRSGPRMIAKAAKALEAAETRLLAARERGQQATGELEALLEQIAKLESTVADRRARIAGLTSQLPPDEAELHEQKRELAGMRSKVESMKRELAKRRDEFAEIIDMTSRDIVAHKDDVQNGFEGYAKGFLLEQCRLVWNPEKDRVGESGPAIDFPAFELEMGGADFPSPVRRQGPEQVSESQREFIDLAFRMALIGVAGIGGIGSIVIDAPESSLDAVFVSRAAAVLSRFASDEGNRLVITSNLIEGDLIPQLMREAEIKSPASRRIVDLLRIAAPTAATSTLADEYDKVRKLLFKKAAKSSRG